jgi:hypothetical protein
MQRILIVAGLLLLLIGLFWPWLGKLPLGRLPGDTIVERQNMRIYFPITSMLLVSSILTLLF